MKEDQFLPDLLDTLQSLLVTDIDRSDFFWLSCSRDLTFFYFWEIFRFFYGEKAIRFCREKCK